MKKQSIFLLCILLSLSFPLCALANPSPHLYLNIPFEGTTEEEAWEIARNEGKVVKNPYPVWQQGSKDETIEEIVDFGYTFRFMPNENPHPNQKGNLENIRLMAGQFVLPEQCREAVEEEIRMFIDLDQQFTKLYGKPTCRYFYAKDCRPYTGKGGYRFESGQWSEMDLKNLLGAEGFLITVTAWDNVWIEWDADVVKYHKRPMHPNSDEISNTYRLGVTITFEDAIVTWPEDIAVYDFS